MMETGIYVRVSTEEQAQEGYSIRAQEQKLKDFSRIKEWGVYDVYIDDGISGKNIADRPAINRLIEDIKNGKVNNVLVFKIDRLTRNTADLIYLVNLFNTYNCAFNSLSESIDTQTASGRMFIKIIGIFAEFERENIIERTKIGFERKVREGYTLATRTPSYGYDRKIGEKIQTVNEYEASIVREVFDMFVNKHMSCLEISKNLNSRNIPTKENAQWHTRTIKNMLTNCNYVGMVRYATKDPNRHFETDGAHEPIISKELYEETQSLIQKISVKCYTKRPKEDSYFIGLLYCAKCGGKMVTHGNYIKHIDGRTVVKVDYRCRNYIKKTCDACNVSHKKVEQAFRDYINNIADLNAIDAIPMSEQQTQEKQNKNVLDGLYRQKKNLEHKEKEIVSTYISGTIGLDDYMNIKKSIEKEKNNISEKIQELENKKKQEVETIKKEDIIKNIRENWDLLTNLEKRQFLINFVDKIIVSSQKVNGRNNIVKVEDIQFHKL